MEKKVKLRIGASSGVACAYCHDKGYIAFQVVITDETGTHLYDLHYCKECFFNTILADIKKHHKQECPIGKEWWRGEGHA